MARYAVVRESDGLIVNMTSWDGVTAWHPGEGFLAVPDPDGLADMGGHWDGESFSPPPPPPDPEPQPPTLEERVAALEIRVTALETSA